MNDLTGASTEAMYVEVQLDIRGYLKCCENMVDILLNSIERVGKIGVEANVRPENHEPRRNRKGARQKEGPKSRGSGAVLGLAQVKLESNRRPGGLEEVNGIGCVRAVYNGVPIVSVPSIQGRGRMVLKQQDKRLHGNGKKQRA